MDGFRTSHAVVIGINAYGKGVPQLRTAVNDARRIAQVLETNFGYAVQVLTEDVTLGKLKAILGESLPTAVQADDRLLVYFAGHGIALDGDGGPAGYLVPQDARPDDRQSFLPMTDLCRWLESLPCRHMLLVLDCCFAGAFRWSSTRELGDVPDVLHRERFDRYIRDPAWQVITSAAYDQKALDVLSGAAIGLRAPETTSDEHSPFAAAFLRALEGEADLYPCATSGRAGGDGVVTANELYLYLRGSVEDDAESGGHRQTPGLWPLKKHDKGEYIHLVPGHQLNLPPAPELDEANNPYRGLQSYDEEHAPVFFGRGPFVRLLAERVVRQPLTIVLGASGTGKSSVVKAGLLPYLRATDPEAWQILPPIRPGKSPLASLASVTFSGEDDDIGSKVADFWTDPDALATRVGAWAAHQPSRRLLLVVDQLEELITLCWDLGERDQFWRLLERALAAHADRLRVVLTLRSDFEPQFAHSPLEGDWMSSRIVVPAMTLDEYREVIEGPAAVKVLYFQGKNSSQEFISRLIGDVANTPGALPLLSFTLSELYRGYLERRGNDRSLREDDYAALGGVGGSLRNRANQVYDTLPNDDYRRTMRKVILRMISVEGGEIARRHVPDDELVYADVEENTRVQEVIRRLTEARLVVEGKETDDQPYVEPAHDELVRGWDKLLKWSNEEAEGLQLRRRLAPAAAAWERGQAGVWATDPRLRVLHRILRSSDDWLNGVETRFVRRSWFWQRAGQAAVVSAFLMLSGITWYALRESGLLRTESERAQKGEDAAKKNEGIAIKNEGIAKEQTRIAREREWTATSRQFAALSVSERNRRLDRSLLLAVEAFRAANTFEARDSFLKALEDRPGIRAFLDVQEGKVSSVAFSPNGKTIAAGFDGGIGGLVLWDAATHQRICADPLPVKEAYVESIAFSPDGKTIAAGCRGRRVLSGDVGYERGACVVLWDVTTRQRVVPDPLPVDAEVRSVAFSPDGKTLAAGFAVPSGGGGGVTLWDITTLKTLTRFPFSIREGQVNSVAFAPDGKTIAAGYAAIQGRGGGVVMWSMDSRKDLPVASLPVAEGPVTGLAFSPDGKAFATADGSGGVLLWDLATRQRMKGGALLTVNEGTVAGVAFSREGTAIAAAYRVGAIGGGMVVWDVATRRRVAPDPFPIKEGPVSSVTISPDGKTIATGYGADSGGVVLWGVSARPVLAEYPVPVGEAKVGSVAFSPDGKSIAAGSPGQVTLWDLSTRPSPEKFALPIKEGDVMSLAFSADSKTIAAGYGNVTEFGNAGLVMWSVATRARITKEPLRVKEGYVYSLAFSADGKTIAAGISHGQPAGALVMWDAAKLERLTFKPLPVDEGLVRGVAFSPDGNTIAAGYLVGDDGSGRRLDGGIILWDAAKRQRLPIDRMPVSEGQVWSVAFSPDGKTIVAGFGVRVDRIRGYGGVVLFDVATSQRLAADPLAVEEGQVWSVAFSRDGKAIAAGYSIGYGPGGVVCWDMATRQRLAEDPFPVKDGPIGTVTFSPDDKAIAAGYAGRGSAVMIDVDFNSWQRIAGLVVNRNFTRNEWRQFFPDKTYRRTWRNLPWPTELPEPERKLAEAKEQELQIAESVPSR